MRAYLPLTILALASVFVSPATAAEISGSWRVTGEVAKVAFVLDCRFEPHGGEAFGGACTEQAGHDSRLQAGKVHPLTRGAVSGNQVRWTYQGNFLFAKFDVNYAGTVDGTHMAGSVEASGRKGAFSATKK